MEQDDTKAATTAPEQYHAAASDVEAIAARGRTIGRYTLLGQIGAGAMGVVHAAYDPILDRKVAIKLLALPRGSDDAVRARLLREAQALAQLSHPNVVVVHDVGIEDEWVWIAMEFVAGQTLGAWATERPRGWQECTRVIADVARGVASAHAAGLVHRDLKPDNIMVSSDGRVRVMDFGLAHGRRVISAADAALAATLAADARARPELAALALRLTQFGSLQGTPAYMAPEQWAGQDVDVFADQFGWGVVAWELLFGERPFAGETMVLLAAAVISGDRRPPRRARTVPEWLRRVVERSLARDPTQRFPSMTVLLAELGRGQGRARRRRLGLALTAAAALAAGSFAVRHWQHTHQVAACEAAGGEIDAVWNDQTRQNVRDAFVATDLSFAASSADRVVSWIDRNTAAWRAARSESCLNVAVRDVWDRDTFERAVSCLDERRSAVESLLAEFVHPDSRTLQYAVTAAAGLVGVEGCLSREVLSVRSVPPAAHSGEIRAVRASLSRARSLGHVRKYSEALDVVARLYV